ncbi:MAG: PAS domain-containing protein [Phycisphaerales bacterium]|nr:PAS domain-containing protein [Phycisphaerales bacterium]
MPPEQFRPYSFDSPRTVRTVAAVGFGLGIALALSAVAPLASLLLMVVSAAFWVKSNNAINRRRVLEIYALLARIGDGEFAATQPDSSDELTLRLQRGVARAQRGYSEALARAEVERDDLRTLLSAIRTGLIALDSQLRIRSANDVAQAMFGLAAIDYRGRLLAEVVRQPELLQLVDDALRADSTTLREINLSGTTVELLTAVADPVRRRDGSSDGLLLAFDDISKIRRLENVRIDFAANVSHELRTPITNINGYLETLLEIGTDDPTQVAHFLGVIHRNTNRLSTLVEDILLLAFLDQRRAGSQLEFSQTAVLAVANDAIEQLSGVATAKEMRIDVRIDPALRFCVNASLVSQALLNLVSNALKFAPAKSTVVVTALLAEGQVRLTVADGGPGIDPVHLPRLFERFYRADKARSRELGGTGLGLSIVKHIAMVHGGSVDVECPSQGGTLFTLRIPQGYRMADPI